MEVKYESYNYQAVSSQGAVAAWSSLITVKFSCSLDVTNFPFDKHECPLRFGQWLSQNDEYKLGWEQMSLLAFCSDFLKPQVFKMTQ